MMMKQLALDIGLATGPTLARFYAGPNEAALQHLRLAAGEGSSEATRSPVPTYLWGEPGSGKTHLLQAVRQALREQGSSVGWLDPAPADLPLRDDLRSRLGWGHVFQLQLLGEAERRAVLRQEADARGVFLGDEVMDYMLNRFSRDLGSLMQLLDQLDAFALRTQRAITIPLLKTMLESE
jgi:DnaA family protein